LDRLALQREDSARIQVIEHRQRPVRVVAPSGHRVPVLDGLTSVGAAVRVGAEALPSRPHQKEAGATPRLNVGHGPIR
jgi:hypothetical protein